jgi:hypothetical protein
MNTKKATNDYEDKAIVVSASDIELIHDALALDGNFHPSDEDIKAAISYALRKTYGRRIEDAAIFI